MGELRRDKQPDRSEQQSAQDRLSQEANAAPPARAPEQKSHKSRSYLESAVNGVTSLFVHDDKFRDEVNRYTCDFAKTAALFAGGKVGFLGTGLVYGLAQARPESGALAQMQDFTLGAAKGETIKGLFGKIGSGSQYIAAKGVMMGIASRGAEAVYQRDLFSDPTKALGRLSNEVTDTKTWAMDGLIFASGEGLFRAGRGFFGRSQLASTVLLGGSFGAANGAAAEIQREKAAGEKFDLTKVIGRTLLQGGLDAAAAGVGAGGSRYIEHTEVNALTSRLKTSMTKLQQFARTERIASQLPAQPPVEWKGPKEAEFIVTDGAQALADFRSNKADRAMVTVREVLDKQKTGDPELGDTKKLFVQRLQIGGKRLLPGAADADLIANCFPENLSPEDRARHVFPEGRGRVWLQTSDGGRLQLSAGWHPISEYRKPGYTEPYRLDGGNTTISAMSDLQIGDAHNLESPESREAWKEFDSLLEAGKDLGLDSISTDVWWDLLEPQKGQFEWSYYDKVFNRIVAKGLKITVNQNFHACVPGGNVGDNVDRPVPNWVWGEVANKAPGGNPESVKYVSEQGHSSREYVSVWATDYALDLYKNVMQRFQEHYANYAPHIAEINIGLGPAGELRFPSYNSHDKGTDYPSRGALQCYSELARASLRDYVLKKYGGDINKVAESWNIPGLTVDKINPPDNPDEFFSRNDHINTQYGRDFIDWYHQSLIDHGVKMMQAAESVFGSEKAPFAGIDLGVKIPGVHWRIGHIENGQVKFADRLAEVTAGLIRTSGDWSKPEEGHGYGDLVKMLVGLQPTQGHGASPVEGTLTAIEMPDGQDGPAAQSLARTNAIWFGQAMKSAGQLPKAENALSGNLYNPHDTDNIYSLLDLPGQNGYYRSINFLRLRDAVNSAACRALITRIVNARQQGTGPKPGT